MCMRIVIVCLARPSHTSSAAPSATSTTATTTSKTTQKQTGRRCRVFQLWLSHGAYKKATTLSATSAWACNGKSISQTLTNPKPPRLLGDHPLYETAVVLPAYQILKLRSGAMQVSVAHTICDAPAFFNPLLHSRWHAAAPDAVHFQATPRIIWEPTFHLVPGAFILHLLRSKPGSIYIYIQYIFFVV